MRLTCPNCDAQYEVPKEVIPDEGRDVQCSNCGDTWFQAHPDHPASALEPDPAPQHSEPEAEDQWKTEPEMDDTEADHDQADHDHSDPEPESPEPEKHPDLDAGITEILREEAAREVQLRAEETAEPLESQPDLGLDSIRGDEPSQRAREARDRMARMRGEAEEEDEPEVDSGSRREMLPDIEEINSSLRATDDDDLSHTALGPVHVDEQQKQRSGFARGFALIVILGGLLAAIYINAPSIAKAVPQADPVLSSYVAFVDQARVWMDAKIGSFVPKPEE